jgi:Flp pilus assembly protein TadD
MKRLFIVMFSCSLFQASCSRLSPEEGEQDRLIRAGDRVQAAGDASSAINVYRSALDKNPAYKLPLYLKLGEAYMNAGRIDDAKKVYEEALPLDENDEIKKQLGRLYLSTGQPDAAISIFDGIVLMHKDDVKALNGLGVAYDLKGEHQLAQGYYRKALSINGENDQTKSNLGLSLAFEGKYEESLKLLRPMGEALGATSKQRHNLALVYALSGDQSKAQEIFGKDMGVGDINENIHAIHMAPRPKIIPQEGSSPPTSKTEKEDAA